MRSPLSRILFAIEFFVALPAVLLAWSQIGGVGHFDAIAWEWKLACSTGLAYAAVRLTAATASAETVWNRSFVLWSLAVFTLVTAMGWQSYQVHLTEVTHVEGRTEESDEVEVQPTAPRL
jgi:hypothetical protein